MVVPALLLLPPVLLECRVARVDELVRKSGQELQARHELDDEGHLWLERSPSFGRWQERDDARAFGASRARRIAPYLDPDNAKPWADDANELRSPERHCRGQTRTTTRFEEKRG